MKTVMQRVRDSRGSALVTVLIVLTTVSAYLGIVVASSSQRAFSATKLADRVRAQLVAEAGVTKAYSILVTNWSARTGDEAFPQLSYAGGTFDCTIVPNETLNMAKISCVGTYGDDQVTVIMDVKNFGSPTAGTGGSLSTSTNAAYGYALLVGGDMEFNGGSGFNLSAGTAHANGAFLKGGNGDLTAGTVTFRASSTYNGVPNLNATLKCDADITTKGGGDVTGNVECDNLSLGPVSLVNGNVTSLTLNRPANVSGTKTVGASTVASVTIPTIDLTPYYAIALANGQVYSSDVHLSGSAGATPAGGVMWVNGTLRISSSGNFTGCFIATVDVDISGSGNFTAVNDYPLLVARDGLIDISGSGRYTGLIYARVGGFEKTGDGDVTGTIICGGDFLAGGNWDVMNYASVPPPLDPAAATGGTPGSSSDVIGVSAWQR